MRRTITIFILACCSQLVMAQQQPLAIFNDRAVINSFSTETLNKRRLDFRIGHRFGDMFGDNGGWQTFFGLENAADIMIGFDYGITDNLTVGINRTKGAGPLKMLVNTYLKYKLAGKQDLSDKPLAVSFVAMNSISTMPKSDEISAINNFPKFAHRLMYHFEMIVAKRFSDRLSLQMNVGYTHRNFVDLDDVNYLLNVGAAGRVRLSKVFAILLDVSIPMRFREVEFEPTVPLGIGFEFTTGGGHIFQVNFTNSSGIATTDYLPNTISKWSEGEFRLGFTISRQFKL